MEIDMRSMILITLAIAVLVIVFMGGQDLGKRNLVIDIDMYGCEKVLAKYHGVTK